MAEIQMLRRNVTGYSRFASVVGSGRSPHGLKAPGHLCNRACNRVLLLADSAVAAGHCREQRHCHRNPHRCRPDSKAASSAKPAPVRRNDDRPRPSFCRLPLQPTCVVTNWTVNGFGPVSDFATARGRFQLESHVAVSGEVQPERRQGPMRGRSRWLNGVRMHRVLAVSFELTRPLPHITSNIHPP